MSTLLLSEELKAKVIERLEQTIAIAEDHYEVAFKLPEIRWDVKNTDGGRANYLQWLVRFNLILCVENEEKFLNTTVPHEMAHLITYQLYFDKLAEEGKKLRPHGVQWKEVMAVVNTPAKTHHTYNCASIQKPIRRRRGSKLRGAEADVLLHRLTTAAKRMPKRHLNKLIATLLSLQEEL